MTLPLFTKEADLALRSSRRLDDARRLARNHFMAELRKASKIKPVYVLCPFHMEKTPSCVIYRKGVNGSRTDHFFCYGCHAIGTLRKFWQQYFPR